MKNKQITLRILAMVAIMTILAGCSFATTAGVATAAPTEIQAATVSAIMTQASSTVIANFTKNAVIGTPALPTVALTPLGTPSPTTTPSLIVFQNSITPSSVMPTVCLGFEPTPISTPLPWINDPNGYWEKIATARLPIQGHECTALDDIVNLLVHQWLDNIIVNTPHLSCGLRDYKVGTINIRPDAATNINTPTPQYDIVAFVDYEVNIEGFSDCGWIPDRGIPEGNGWIKTHDPFGVYRQDGFYQLVVLSGWGA